MHAEGVWSPSRRPLTLGLVLTISLVALESLAVATIMPAVKDDLGGLSLYGWAFSAFPLAGIVGIVVAGQHADGRGPAAPFAMGFAVFAVGLLVAGLASSMPMLVLGRAVQGFGAGAIPATAYVSIGRTYPSTVRPRMFAILSTAWVVPGLVGPALAGVVADHAGWRVVFLGLLPFLVVPGVVTVRALRPIGPVPEAERDADPRASRLPGALRLAAGTGMILGGLTGTSVVLAVPLVAAGLWTAVPAFVRLVPPGTLRAAPGLPSAILVRGMVTFAFFGTDAFVPLALTDTRGVSVTFAGLAITAATVSWTAGAWIQERLIGRTGAAALVTTGHTILLGGILVTALVLVDDVPVGVGVAGWAVGGLGIGLSYAAVSVTVLAEARPGREGEATAALQLTDMLGFAIGTGLGGAAVALGDGLDWDPAVGIGIAFAMCASVAAGGALVARRLPATVGMRPTDRGRTDAGEARVSDSPTG